MIQKFTSLFFLLTILNFVFASGQDIPKHEFRASWLTTVWGLDWPRNKITQTGDQYTITLQKQNLVNLLDSVKKAGLNAVFFQVRPECDAFYQSSYEPWSAHLVQTRGMDPGYDPLLFAIEECHQRGLELHAWLNPYRFESVAGKYAGQEGDYNQTHPEWVLTYGNDAAILDPGNPEVRERINEIVEEIIQNYDVDGIVFDDYFYAYGGTPESLDQYSQNNWKPESMDLHDWRRQNVNQMVAGVYETIQQNKPWVTFGVSPFGIWTMDPQVAASYGLSLPSGITGMDAYKSIYCDPVAWLNEGTVDYISPQLYWPTTSSGQDYKKLAPWWSDVVNHFGRHLYVSHSLTALDESNYPPPMALKSASRQEIQEEMKGLSMMEYISSKSAQTSVAGLDPSEYGLQIQWNRNSDKNQAPGSVFFRTLMINRQGFINYLRTHEYQNNALPPLKPWNNSETRELPENLRIEGDSLLWDSSESDVRFAVYAFPNEQLDEPGIFSDGSFLLGLSYSTTFNLDKYQHLTDDHTFAVSVFDRNGYEFPPVIMGYEPHENKSAVLISPAKKQGVFEGFHFKWNAVQNSELYIIEVANDSLFNSVIYKYSLSDTVFASSNIAMKEDSAYYWRVYTRMSGVEDAVSETRSFTLLPLPKPEITYPENEAADIGVTPLIQWKPFDEGFTFRMQISTSNLFSSMLFDQSGIDGTSYELPSGTLYSYSTYYLRMRAENDDSVTVWSDVVRFSTVTTPPSIPVIISPAEGDEVSQSEVEITVEEEPLAKSITFQLSNSASFPWNNRLQYSVDAPSYTLTLDDLDDGTWYVKARANYGTASSTDWSEVISFTLLTTFAEEIPEEKFTLQVPTVITNEPVRIKYYLPQPSTVQIYLTDIAGRRTQISEKAFRIKGEHTTILDNTNLVRGIYLLTIETNYGRKTVKMLK
ncbi:MAG: family 10 glycosylhydrolase [Bacteroidota bacterium]